MFPGVLQSEDLINKFHRTKRQQGPAAGRARVDYDEEKQNIKEWEGVRHKKAIGMRDRRGLGQQRRKDKEVDRLELEKEGV